jgi:alcohol dehydrogenase (cytochrome c)
MKRLILITLALCANTAFAQVNYERLVNAAKDGDNWLTYSGTYRSERYSPLDQINSGNVGKLKVIWAYQMQPSTQAGSGLVETTPIVVDGIMYLTEPPSTVTALDVRTGKMIWSWSPDIPNEVLSIGFPRVNRGVALLDDAVYVGTLDAHLVTLDAATGAVRWDVEVADNKKGFALTLAPLAIEGKIIVGVSGAEAGVRGFVDAYDSATGERLWRFHTIPGPGDPGSETWQGDAWQTGGGSTWLTGSYDPDLDLLYWTVGNPSPDWNGDVRPGDNLYSCSLIALDPNSGFAGCRVQ